jgi:hypothetical protein
MHQHRSLCLATPKQAPMVVVLLLAVLLQRMRMMRL